VERSEERGERMRGKRGEDERKEGRGVRKERMSCACPTLFSLLSPLYFSLYFPPCL
jgi:hypothetical protein